MTAPSIAEIKEAATRLWTGDQTQHVETVVKVLREVNNMRAWEAKR